ncbi:MAG: hypothetical protein BGO54_04550 [Sphingobacteriales bacterium 46-32]|nr:MAG: hypothetical protein BGO54_04550 [Sphingobacteriales bacterium 46-32]
MEGIYVLAFTFRLLPSTFPSDVVVQLKLRLNEKKLRVSLLPVFDYQVQFNETGLTKAVGESFFQEIAGLCTQCYITALAVSYITHPADKRPLATRTAFFFVCLHCRKKYKSIKVQRAIIGK